MVSGEDFPQQSNPLKLGGEIHGGFEEFFQQHGHNSWAYVMRFVGPTKNIWSFWVNYNELTTSSLEIIVSKGNHPQMALIQVSELL